MTPCFEMCVFQMYLDCIGLSLNMAMSWHVAGCVTEVLCLSLETWALTFTCLSDVKNYGNACSHDVLN